MPRPKCRIAYLTLLLTSVLNSCLVAGAQSGPLKVDPESTGFGAVTGQVSFVGNNSPVRFASVALQPIEVKSTSSQPGKLSATSYTIYQTDLSGDFRIDHVRPGSYYVVVEYPGALSPFASFTQAELEHPSAEIEQKIAASIPTVSVRANNTVATTLSLQTGASISGTARFDDGIPFVHAFVQVERRGPDGKWAAPRAAEASSGTDFAGRWEVGGLPPGEYRVMLNLNVQERHQSTLLGDNGSTWNNTTLTVPLYLGDTTRERDAATVTLTAAQQLTGQDITVPVSKMHTLTGAVVDARTGQALNAGHVELTPADGGKVVCSAEVDPESRSFSIPFVLEGTYKLSTKDAREARIETIPLPEGSFGSPQRKVETLRQYAAGEIPIVVQSDVDGISLPVPVKSSKAP